MSKDKAIKKRKIVQLVAATKSVGNIFALCDDGSVWFSYDLTEGWHKISTTQVEEYEEENE